MDSKQAEEQNEDADVQESLDSDEEPVVIRRKKTVNRTIIDSDEESNQSSEVSSKNKVNTVTTSDSEGECDEVRESQNKKTISKAIIDSDDSDEDSFPSSSKNLENEAVTKKISKKRLIVNDDSESDDEENSKTVDHNINDDNEGNASLDLEKSNKNKIIPKEKVLDELFDAENSSSDEDKEDIAKKPVDEGYHGDQGESEDEDQGISAALKKKLGKGAAKKPKKPSIKARKEHVQQIHSDSQRMMREREVRMPYHEPKKVGLSVFLARTQQKHEALKKFTPGSWKNTPDLSIHEDNISSKKSKLKETIEKRMEKCKEVEKESMVPKGDNLCNSVDKVKKQLDLDDLPDLVVETEQTQEETNSNVKTFSKESESMTCSETKKVLNLLNRSSDLVETGNFAQNKEIILEADIESLKQQTESFDLMDTDCSVAANRLNVIKGDGEKLEQDSGYLSTPLNSSEEESNGTGLINPEDHSESDSQTDVVSKNDKSNATVNTSEELKICDNDVHGDNNSELECNKETERTEKETNESISETLSIGENKDSTVSTPLTLSSLSKKTPKLMGLGVSLPPAPRLSGGPDSFIDLLAEDKTPKASPGVQKLMERLMKHSSKRTGKKAHDVEISTIVKEGGEDGDNKQELKVDKFVYHVEGEEEENAELNKPGAKLIRLKEKLKEKMNAEREKARQMRNELHDMENEDGFDDEEEAELTDGSETDGDEEDIVDEEVDDDEMDMEEYTEGEKRAKQENPFVDNEAEDDDDEDEIDEEGLHLQFDTQDSQDADGSNKAAKSKNFLEKAISKTKSMDLFDEEANTESPTMSQKSNSDKVDISERPFEQLSQVSKPIAEDEDSQLASTQPLPFDDRDQSNTCQSLFKDSSFNNSMDCQDSSFELIPAGQRTGRKSRLDDSPSSKSSILSSKKSSSLIMPVENSQDLFTMTSSFPTQQPKSQPSQPQFSMDESESNLLDEEGFAKTESTKKTPRRQLQMTQKDSIDDMDEILGLCSGQFSEDQSSKSLFENDEQEINNTQELLGLCSGRFTEKSSAESQENKKNTLIRHNTEPFTVENAPILETQGNMNELLGLCSGRFTGNNKETSQEEKDDEETTDSPVKKQPKKRKAVIRDDDSDQEEEDDFEVASHCDNSEDEQEAAEELSSADEVEDTEKENRKVFTGFKNKKKKLLQEFVDDQAELSGSEAESDEDYDLRDEDDILEEEEGDHDIQMTEEELRNQVGRVHLKSVIDSDKREIRLMQEMYLQDGDLYKEGSGRQRKFRWRNIDDDTQDDLFNNASDEEVAEDEVELEKWRVERHEREKFLKEQMEKEFMEGKIEESSQPIKLGKVCFKPKKVKSTTPMAQLNPTENVQEPDAQQKKTTPLTPPGLFKVPALKKKAGSFLGRSSQALAKIAEMHKPVSKVNGPRSNARGTFVFSSLSEEEKQSQDEERKTQVKRSNSTPKQSVAKRPRLEKSNSLPKDSIFNLLH